MRFRIVSGATILMLLLAADASLAGAQGAAVGVPKADSVRLVSVSDTALASLLAGIQVLHEGSAGDPSLDVRVIAAWGPWAGADCGCLTQVLYFVLRGMDVTPCAYKLGPLLEPAVDRIVTEHGRPVVYVSYGPRGARQRLRIALSLERAEVAAAPR